MTDGIRDDDVHDEALGAALRSAAAQPPFDDVDWAALHQRIQAHARPLLAQSRSTRLLHLLGRWSSRGNALAGSAAVALTLLLGFSALVSSSAQDTTEFRTVEEELAQALPAAARPLLVASGETDAMLDAVLFFDAEEW